MYQDQTRNDSAVEWISIEETTSPQKSKRKWLAYTCVGGAMLLGLLTVAVIAKKVHKLSSSAGLDVPVMRYRNFREMRDETVAAFQEYDGARDPYEGLSAEKIEERKSIEQLFQTVESCALESDSDRFFSLVDTDRFLKRMDITGSLNQYTNIEKMMLRGELKDALDVDYQWGELEIVKINTTTDDSNTRIVYAYGWEGPEKQDALEVRFLIAKVEDEWKIYDWCQLDLGIYESWRIGLYARYVNTQKMDGFTRWAELVGEADELNQQGEVEAAQAKLKQAEKEPVPRELADYRWVLTGYRWQLQQEFYEAERCFLQVNQPKRVPGAYYGLMNCKRSDDVVEALKYAVLYEQTVGPNPELSRIKARLYASDNQIDRATTEWERLITFQPDDQEALLELMSLKSNEGLKSVDRFLDRLRDPVETLSSIATSVAWRDFATLQYVRDYMKTIAPNASGTFYVDGLLSDITGDYESAAKLYRNAFEAEEDSSEVEQYVNRYVQAMCQLGLGTEVLKMVPDPETTFQALTFDYIDDNSYLTEEEFLTLTEEYHERYPQAIEGYYYMAYVADQAGDFLKVEKIAREGVTKSVEDENQEYGFDGDTLPRYLSYAIYKNNRIEEAYGVLGSKGPFFAYLCRHAVDNYQWEDLKQIIELHRKRNPNDPLITFYEGELAAYDGDWNAAILKMSTGLVDEADENYWNFKTRLEDVYVKSGRWLEYYRNSTGEGREEVFATLIQRLIDDKQWQAAEQLLVEHQRHYTKSSSLAWHRANFYWQQKDFLNFEKKAELALAIQGKNAIEGYQRSLIERRLLFAYLSNENYRAAQKLAEQKQKDEGDSSSLAIVKAVIGNLTDAEQLAFQAADEAEGASLLYTNDLAASFFLGSRFGKLHEKYPIEFQYDIAQSSVVYYSDNPWSLQEGDIRAVLKNNLGLESAVVKPLKIHGKKVASAFVIQLNGSSIWIAMGNADIHSELQLSAKPEHLAAIAEDCRHWLAIGLVGWTDAQRDQSASLYRQIAVELAKDNGKLFRPRNYWLGGKLTMLPVQEDLIRVWESSGTIDSISQHGIRFRDRYKSDAMIANRQFDQEFMKAARTFESSADPQFDVLVYLPMPYTIDPMRIRVTSIERQYGSIQLTGTLVTSSLLVPELSKGLNIQVSGSRVLALKLDSAPPVIRKE